jgi:hypothetical protein
MRIIALRGGDSCGKTETINLVYNRVILNVGTSTNKQQVGGDIRDFSDVVNFKGQTVAFYSMGDLAYATIGAINKYDALGIDVLIIANNIKFVKPIQLIITFAHNLVIKTIASPKTTVNNSIANTTDANIIFGLI